jgi:UDPglucose 6-dehydrogenase
MREAPSRVLIDALLAEGAIIQAYDPEAMSEARRLYGENSQIRFCDSAKEVLNGANALAIVTEWKQFSSPNFAKVSELLLDKVIFDGRNLYEPATVKSYGLTYHAIGR